MNAPWLMAVEEDSYRESVRLREEVERLGVRVRQLEHALREAARNDVVWRVGGPPNIAGTYYCRRCLVPAGNLHRSGCLYEVLGEEVGDG